MITFCTGHRYYLYRGFVDMRKSFDCLSGLVTNELGRQATSGEVYIFINRCRDQVKLLVWDRSGFVIYYKRLEKGMFEMPREPEGKKTRTVPPGRKGGNRYQHAGKQNPPPGAGS